jgi:hypothetical protein
MNRVEAESHQICGHDFDPKRFLDVGVQFHRPKGIDVPIIEKVNMIAEISVLIRDFEMLPNEFS